MRGHRSACKYHICRSIIRNSSYKYSSQFRDATYTLKVSIFLDYKLYLQSESLGSVVSGVCELLLIHGTAHDFMREMSGQRERAVLELLSSKLLHLKILGTRAGREYAIRGEKNSAFSVPCCMALCSGQTWLGLLLPCW